MHHTARRQHLLLPLILVAITPLLFGFLCFPLIAPAPTANPTPVPNAIFAPTVSANVLSPTPNAPSDIEAHMSFPEGSTLAIGATFDVPAGWNIAPDAEITDGSVMGKITGFMTVDDPAPQPPLTFFGCTTTVNFDEANDNHIVLYEATTDTSTKVAGTDTTLSGKPDVIDDVDPANGLPDGVDKYPSFLNTVLPGTHKARYFGHTEAAGVSDLYFNIVVIELPSGAHTVVTIVNDPTALPESATNRFCAPQSNTLTLFGTSQDNPATGTAEGGQAALTNPSSGSYTFSAALASEFDVDNDGLSNGKDNCPFTANASQLDSDEDYIGDACDADPLVANFDVDGDGLENGYDNCIFVGNASQADGDFDDIGDVCDPNTSSPNGPNYYLTCTDPVGIGQADPGGASCVDTIKDHTDTDGDGCSDQRENGLDETRGGLRDPENPWDFYDVSGATPGVPDRFIDLLNDVLGVINHFAPTGNEATYDSHYDRGPAHGPYTWNMTAPDGKIDLLTDVLGVIAQFAHDCRP